MANQNPGEVDTIVSAFTTYLKKEHKDKLLPAIVKELSKVVAGDLQKGEIVSSVPVSLSQIKMLEEKMSKKFGKTVTLTNTIDESILGGVIIRFGDVVIDESVKSKLAKVTEEIYGS